MENFRFTSAGWIGTIAKDFTFDNVRRVTQGIANYVKQNDLSRRGIIVAYDHRFMSEDFAAECTRVLLGNGIRVFRAAKALPAPAVSYAVYKLQLGGGIMITANYSGAYRNGVKFIPEYAGPILEDSIQKISQEIQKVLEKDKIYEMDIEEAREFDLVSEVNIDRDYINHLKRLILPTLFNRHGQKPIRVVVDPMFGSGSGYAEKILQDLGCQVKVINHFRDTLFGGSIPGPWDYMLTDLKRAVVSYQADLGVALDGDGGTFGIVDETGQYVSVNNAVSLILVHMLKTRSLRGPICRSVSTTHMLDRIALENGLPLIETPVGFRYVADTMRQKSGMLGAEENGGFTVMGHNSDKDGILACLLMAEARSASGQSISEMQEELWEEYGNCFHTRIDQPLNRDERERVIEKLKLWKPHTLAGYSVLDVKSVEKGHGCKIEFEGGAWLLVRTAEVANRLRIYIEGSERQFLYDMENLFRENAENLFTIGYRTETEL